MADSRRKFNMATILNDEARTVGIWGCKNGLTVEKKIMGSVEYALSLFCRTHVLFSRWWPLGTIQYGAPFHLTNSSLVFNIEAFNFKSSMVTTKRNR